jgi:hypothetical protein
MVIKNLFSGLGFWLEHARLDELNSDFGLFSLLGILECWQNRSDLIQNLGLLSKLALLRSLFQLKHFEVIQKFFFLNQLVYQVYLLDIDYLVDMFKNF